jgi:hypothetical protein
MMDAEKSTMRLFPLSDILVVTHNMRYEGYVLFQQFNCSGCGIKQTMSEPNSFYTSGKCEACGHVTDIAKDGCNYMAATNIVGDIIKSLT